MPMRANLQRGPTNEGDHEEYSTDAEKRFPRAAAEKIPPGRQLCRPIFSPCLLSLVWKTVRSQPRPTGIRSCISLSRPAEITMGLSFCP